MRDIDKMWTGLAEEKKKVRKLFNDAEELKIELAKEIWELAIAREDVSITEKAKI